MSGLAWRGLFPCRPPPPTPPWIRQWRRRMISVPSSRTNPCVPSRCLRFRKSRQRHSGMSMMKVSFLTQMGQHWNEYSTDDAKSCVRLLTTIEKEIQWLRPPPRPTIHFMTCGMTYHTNDCEHPPNDLVPNVTHCSLWFLFCKIPKTHVLEASRWFFACSLSHPWVWKCQDPSLALKGVLKNCQTAFKVKTKESVRITYHHSKPENSGKGQALYATRQDL